MSVAQINEFLKTVAGPAFSRDELREEARLMLDQPALRAALSQAQGMREALEGVLRVADRATDEFDAARRALAQEGK